MGGWLHIDEMTKRIAAIFGIALPRRRTLAPGARGKEASRPLRLLSVWTDPFDWPPIHPSGSCNMVYFIIAAACDKFMREVLLHQDVSRILFEAP